MRRFSVNKYLIYHLTQSYGPIIHLWCLCVHFELCKLPYLFIVISWTKTGKIPSKCILLISVETLWNTAIELEHE